MSEDVVVGFTVFMVVLAIAAAVVVGIFAGMNATNKVNARLTKIGVACVQNPERIWVHNACLLKTTPTSITAVPAN